MQYNISGMSEIKEERSYLKVNHSMQTQLCLCSHSSSPTRRCGLCWKKKKATLIVHHPCVTNVKLSGNKVIRKPL